MGVNLDEQAEAHRRATGRVGAVITGIVFLVLGAVFGDTDAHGVTCMIGGFGLMALGWLAPYVERVVVAFAARQTQPEQFGDLEAVHKRLSELEEDAVERVGAVTEQVATLVSQLG